jgi:homogentisate 1,2-dioxygenase
MRRPFLSNANVKLRFWRVPDAWTRSRPQRRRRRTLFVHEGAATSIRGLRALAVTAGATSRCCRVGPCGGSGEHGADDRAVLSMATNGSYLLPGQGAGRTACDLSIPPCWDTPKIDDMFLKQQGPAPGEVKIKRRDAISTVTFPYNPLDAVGWKGDLAPVRINVKDIRPLMSHRYHLPPSAHTTLSATASWSAPSAAAVRDRREDALKVPFFHNNDDYDEVLFYHAGDFFSRDNIKPGHGDVPSLRLHPRPAPEGAEERVHSRPSPRPMNTRHDRRPGCIASRRCRRRHRVHRLRRQLEGAWSMRTGA